MRPLRITRTISEQKKTQIRTDAVRLEEHLLELADVPVLQPFEDADLARERALLVLGLRLALAQAVQVPPEVARVDHLHRVPLVLCPVQRLHDCRERALAELVLHVVVLVQATRGWPARHMAVDESWK